MSRPARAPSPAPAPAPTTSAACSADRRRCQSPAIGQEVEMEPLRIGILGAARITELALIKPAIATGATLVAVAARDRSRANAFAEHHRIGKVHDTYDQLLADPEVEAIYNPLPNSLHGPWNRRALEAG